MITHLFRKQIDTAQAHTRLVTPDDLNTVSRLLGTAGRRYYGIEGNDLPHLLKIAPGVLLAEPPGVWGVALTGWPRDTSTWLRSVALARIVPVETALYMMLPVLHETLAARGGRHIFYAGDEGADAWLMPVLQATGYQHETDVIVYEKTSLHIPSWGNQQIRVRPVRPADLAALVRLDAECFEPHWAMPAASMDRAMTDGALFVLAEGPQQPAGYAYLTSHFSGKLLHLVRIAVDPLQRQRGTGTRLLAEVVQYARRAHAELITLNTQAYNEQAQGLYRRFGFVPNGDYQSVLRFDLSGSEPGPTQAADTPCYNTPG